MIICKIVLIIIYKEIINKIPKLKNNNNNNHK